MACTTILVGKKASYDGSTMIARNDDSGSGHFTAKKFVVVQPEEHPAVYKSVLSHVEIPLPGDPMRMTAMPNAVEGKGIWAAAGVNAANVGMTATETITSNPRVLGADPLVVYQPAMGDTPEVPGGIGEEDIVYLVLPYIHTAREGVQRLGQLLLGQALPLALFGDKSTEKLFVQSDHLAAIVPDRRENATDCRFTCIAMAASGLRMGVSGSRSRPGGYFM